MKSIANSLSAKFLALIISILSITLGATSYWVIKSEEQLMVGALTEKVKALGEFAALVSADSIITYDFSSLNRTMSELTHQGDVVYSMVSSASGKAVSSYANYKDPFIKLAVRELALKNINITDWWKIISYLRTQRNVTHLVFPIKFDGKKLGKVHIGVSTVRVQRQIRGLFIEHVLANLGIIIFLSICIYLAFRVNTLKPIERLVRGSELIARGNLGRPIEVTSRDELGRLTKSFNSMMDTLRESNEAKDKAAAKSIDLNTTLEERVLKRTEQLTDSEERIHTILNTVGEGIITINKDGVIVSVNKAIEISFRAAKHEIIGTHSSKLLSDKKWVEMSLKSDYIDEKQGAFKGGQADDQIEYEGLRKNGQTFLLEIVVTQVELNDEDIRIVVLRDISYRKELEQRLAEAAHKSGMADLATGVLHNIGNILNSVNIAGEEIARISRNSKVVGLIKANSMLYDNMDNISEFIRNDTKGRLLPEYFIKLGEQLQLENKAILGETGALNERIKMMREVIDTQQTYACAGGYFETVDIKDLVMDSLRVLNSSLVENNVQVDRQFDEIPPCHIQKSKLSQVVTNIIKNSIEAMVKNDECNQVKKIKIRLEKNNEENIQLTVTDNGHGISIANIDNIFNHGFTTKKSGHGFGLHTCANSMTEMKGSIRVESKGIEQGATFIIVIPVVNNSAAINRKNQAA